MLLRDIHVPPDWAAAAGRAIEGGGPVLVLGAVDSGKSTLARHLLARFISAKGSAVLLDGDVGMAMVGPPALVGLTLVRDVDSIDQRPAPDRAWFVGSTTPVGSLLPVVLGHAKLIGVARSSGFPIVVNTSGFVSGGLAKELHLAVADAIEPRAVLGIEVEGELEHLLGPLARRGVEVLRLAPSARARTKPRSERSHRRAERFGRALENARLVDLRVADYALEGSLLGFGRPLTEREHEAVERGLDARVVEGEVTGDAVALVLASAPHDEGIEALERALGGRRVHVVEAAETIGLVIGFLAGDGECLGLGLLDAWNGDGVLALWTALEESALKDARRLRLGAIRLSRAGVEMGPWSREKLLGGAEERARPERPDVS